MANWARYLTRLIANETVLWQDIPGYALIVDEIIDEMTTTPIVAYPEGLKDATVALLANDNLLTRFVRAAFTKTSYPFPRSI